MEQHEKSYFVLGCMDRSEAYCIPFDVVKENIEDLNTTKKKDGHYWHVALSLDGDDLKWNISRAGKKIDLSQYSLNI